MPVFPLIFSFIFLFLASSGEVFSQNTPKDSSESQEKSAALTAETATKMSQEMLSGDQKKIAENYQRFDEMLLRMSELMSVTDPDRSALLARVITQSREKMIRMRFDSIVELLDEKSLSKAQDNQQELYEDLKSLLVLLESENRSTKIREQKERLRAYLKEVNQLIREEQSLQSRTENAQDVTKLAEAQHEIARKTGEFARKIDGENQDANSPLNPGNSNENSDNSDPNSNSEQQEGSDSQNTDKPSGQNATSEKNDGKNPDGKSESEEKSEGSDGKSESGDKSEESDGKSGESQKGSGQSGNSSEGSSSENSGEKNEGDSPEENTPQQKLRQAQQKMQEAEEKLREAEKKGAVEEQEKALRELEAAKAQLEEILRQIREEEAKRYLTLLESRLKKMQQMQKTVYEDTTRLSKIPVSARTHDHTIESTRLSRRESDIVLEADKTLLLLREDGTAIALPEVLAQARDDMSLVTDMLGQGDVGDLTISLEEDILAALEEMIAAVEKALQDMNDEQQQQQKKQQQSMEEQDPALIDLLTEVKMIRSMQLRVNNRTERIGKMISGEHTDKPDLLEILKGLSQQQARIRQITRDLATGKNE
ncbi:MAG: hypothetical protein Q4C96_08320 [Planctomycetia bacterium]|nr:hypothetical protein [Planctomycetia bacterium]